jgi:hypothetical protein
MSAKDAEPGHTQAEGTAHRLGRPLAIAGLAGLLIGAIDPLEGSMIVLLGTLLAACGAWTGRNPQRHQLLLALACVAAGVAALWALSAVGGIGGPGGHSNWWGLLLLPYPIGWVMALVGVFRIMRDRTPPDASIGRSACGKAGSAGRTP